MRHCFSPNDQAVCEIQPLAFGGYILKRNTSVNSNYSSPSVGTGQHGEEAYHLDG